jgi:hypothetical protein
MAATKGCTMGPSFVPAECPRIHDPRALRGGILAHDGVRFWVSSIEQESVRWPYTAWFRMIPVQPRR